MKRLCREFEAELANNPNHVQAMAHLGDTDMKLSHPEAAVPLFEKAIKIDPGLELAYLDLGIAYAATGRNDDALREMKAAERLAPTTLTFTGGWGGSTARWEIRMRQRLNWTRQRTLPRPPIPLSSTR